MRTSRARTATAAGRSGSPGRSSSVVRSTSDGSSGHVSSAAGCAGPPTAKVSKRRRDAGADRLRHRLLAHPGAQEVARSRAARVRTRPPRPRSASCGAAGDSPSFGLRVSTSMPTGPARLTATTTWGPECASEKWMPADRSAKRGLPWSPDPQRTQWRSIATSAGSSPSRSPSSVRTSAQATIVRSRSTTRRSRPARSRSAAGSSAARAGSAHPASAHHTAHSFASARITPAYR